MDLHVTQESTEAETHRTIHLNNVRDSERENVAIFFEMVGEHNVPVPQVLAGFVFGIIFYAMRLGQSIRVHGAVSRDALRNLNELQEAWCLWRGDRYKNVDISAEQIVDAVNGEHDPMCFTTPLDTRQIKDIPLRNGVDCAELASIVAYAKATGVEATWHRELEARVKRHKPPMGLRKLARKIETAWNMATRGEILLYLMNRAGT
jgi:hypothetical protein